MPSSELTVVYASAELKSKPVFAMTKEIVELDLQNCFPEAYRLCQLIFTMPSTSALAEKSFSALKRIKTYPRRTCNVSVSRSCPSRKDNKIG
jgi:hypothetical protein